MTDPFALDVVIVVTYERCRSEAGVPRAMLPRDRNYVRALDADELTIDDVLEIFTGQAQRAHPGKPAMQMPSSDVRDYHFEDDEGRPVHLNELELKRVDSLSAAKSHVLAGLDPKWALYVTLADGGYAPASVNDERGKAWQVLH